MAHLLAKKQAHDVGPFTCGLLALILATCFIQQIASMPHNWADNVCKRSVPVKKDIFIEQPVEYEIKVQSMCGILPCTKTRLETRQNQIIKTIIVQEEEVACCEGYAETPTKQCAPICLDSCNSGQCVAPNVCKCQPEPSESSPGFVGPTCKRFTCLKSQRWGLKCDRECSSKCSRNSYCSADTGKCLCYPGWHGPDCSLECDINSNVDECQESNKLPPILEPNANLFMLNEFTRPRAQQFQALVLENDNKNATSDDVEILPPSSSSSMIKNEHPLTSFMSICLVGLLTFVIMILFIGFLVYKRRYELVRNELYYATAASAIGSSMTSRRPGSSAYSLGGDSSSYYTGNNNNSNNNSDDNFGKNLSFAEATRNILTFGFTTGTGKQDSSASIKNSVHLTPAVAPLVESHLMRSHSQANANIYSEINSSSPASKTKLANRSRAQTPERQQKQQLQQQQQLQGEKHESSVGIKDEDDHIYSVPKSPTKDKSDHHTETGHNISLDMSRVEEDSDNSNIYEEIKPRAGGIRK